MYGADNNAFVLGASIAAQGSDHTHQYSRAHAASTALVTPHPSQESGVYVVRSIEYSTVDTTPPSTSNTTKGPLVAGTVGNYIIRCA